ncbi:hypothetical protein [Dietzia sp.]|uniref:hypothetical protein n=1 Tax=Dietzia sp. TaxID=1871616 RepID=UPI002FDB2AE0
MNTPQQPDPGNDRPEQPSNGGPDGQESVSPLDKLRAQGGGENERRGNFRMQTPENAVQRAPSLAESRERDRVRREAEEAARRQAEADRRNEEKRRRRKTYLIAGGVGAGLVAVLAGTYLAASSSSGNDYESAQCVNEQNVVVDDQYCADNSNGHSGPGGMFLFFVGGNSYRYSYGSNAPVGQVANGSSTPQSGKSYATGGGKEVSSNGSTGSSVKRGGLGSSSGSKGSSGGGKSSGS